MKLTGLKPLYISIKRNNLTYGIFKYQVNKVSFEIFFDISTIPYQLGFIQRQSTFQLWIEIKNGFEVTPYIDENSYKNLIKILNLKFNPENHFSIKKFFEEFNTKIPNTYISASNELLYFVSKYRYNIEEPDKLFFKDFKPWSSRKRTKKNTEKTRLLFPLIYNRIKNIPNISVAYTNINSGEIDKEIPINITVP